jgi:hypothetical protein
MKSVLAHLIVGFTLIILTIGSAWADVNTKTVKSDNIQFCVGKSRVAYQIAEAIRDHGWDRTEAYKQMQFPIVRETPKDRAEQNLVLMALVNDVFRASDYVLEQLLKGYKPGATKVVDLENYVSTVAQVVLETCTRATD